MKMLVIVFTFEIFHKEDEIYISGLVFLLLGILRMAYTRKEVYLLAILMICFFGHRHVCGFMQISKDYYIS